MTSTSSPLRRRLSIVDPLRTLRILSAMKARRLPGVTCVNCVITNMLPSILPAIPGRSSVDFTEAILLPRQPRTEPGSAPAPGRPSGGANIVGRSPQVEQRLIRRGRDDAPILFGRDASDLPE